MDVRENKYINNNANDIDNLFTVGIYNGKSNYHFTSIESSVQNALDFAKKENPNLKYQYSKLKHLDLTEIIHNFILLIIFLVVLISVKQIFFKDVKDIIYGKDNNLRGEIINEYIELYKLFKL
jgi:hypothetical protein